MPEWSSKPGGSSTTPSICTVLSDIRPWKNSLPPGAQREDLQLGWHQTGDPNIQGRTAKGAGPLALTSNDDARTL